MKKSRPQRNGWEGAVKMFLFKQKKGKKKLRTQASIEILDRLNGYLDENTAEPVEFLV